MYYAEEVVNGVLCWKDTPDGKWNQFSPEELTKRLFDLKKKFDLSNSRIDELEGICNR